MTRLRWQCNVEQSDSVTWLCRTRPDEKPSKLNMHRCRREGNAKGYIASSSALMIVKNADRVASPVSTGIVPPHILLQPCHLTLTQHIYGSPSIFYHHNTGQLKSSILHSPRWIGRLITHALATTAQIFDGYSSMTHALQGLLRSSAKME